ncbi:hypothetical protein PAXRUDRAFT_824646 [Paxillus rubicundulus Ve08.2h10]|uniref:Cleavage stimulation factor subunit 2 hinge domain-containing protein n=1 Tax=Paxillus rubicundulus Ve08.2h10 TaxID=930991 RepID=A0A0D0E7I6_9AGAM|nr:hypothetical protein PAXRUDRAFT_824646 [Paxillus rubicundulus Ve08.2h10]
MSSQEEQLIELMLTLKKTTPDQARAILTSTPQIAYALIALMVKMNAVDVQVLQKTLATYSANMPPPPAPPTSQMTIQAPPMQPASAVPPHFSQYRTPTPQTHTPPQYNGHGNTPPSQGPYMAQMQSHYAGPSGYGTPPPAAPQMGGLLPDALASIPEEQKTMILRVIAMTPEQINMLPPTERSGIIQLRTTLGLPS